MIRGQILWRGVTFGVDTDVDIVDIAGLDDLPEADYSGTPRPRAHGAFPGDVLAQARAITVTFEIAAADTAAARKAFRAATVYTQGGITEPLQFLVDDATITVHAQLLRRNLALPGNYDRITKPVVQWTCPDPRRYAPSTSVQIPFPAGGTGLTYPFVYPSNYAPGESGARSVTNAGTTPTPVVITIPGLLTRPWVEFILPTGEVKRLDIDLTIAAGEPLILDSLNNTALVGAANRYTALSGALLAELFLPAGTTTIRWGAFSGTPSSNLIVVFADAEM